MKKFRLNIVILVSVSLLIMYLIMKDDFNEIMDNILNANIFYLLICVLLVILNIFFQACSMHLYLKEIDPTYKFKDTFILMYSAQFFNAITPFSSGGQPFQVYLLNKQGIGVSESANALLQNFFSYQLSLTILGTAAIIANKFLNVIPSTSVLKNVVIIGFLVNVFVLFVIIFLSKAKKVNTKVFNKIFNFIFGFKFIKNREALKEKANRKIDEFYESSQYYKKNKYILVKSMFYNILSLLVLYSVPLFIFYSVNEFDSINLLTSLICTSYVYFIGSFVPIPGGTGGLEYAFIEFFKKFTGKTVISTCMILWRFITYYLSMLLGAVSLLFVKKKVK